MKRQLFAIALAAMMISACSTTSKPTVAQNSSQDGSQSGQLNSTPEASNTSSNGLADSLRNMAEKSVYFDFDQYAIKPEFRAVIEQQADFMKANKNVVLTLVGNADERGSAEYNLALGSQRANAVRKALVVAGVSTDQIKVVSVGEENPKLNCHDESCWKENRRVDFNGKSDS